MSMLVRKGSMLHRNASRRYTGRRASTRGALAQRRASSAAVMTAGLATGATAASTSALPTKVSPSTSRISTPRGSVASANATSLLAPPQPGSRIRARSVGDPTSAGFATSTTNLTPQPSQTMLTVPTYGPYLNLAYCPSRPGSEPGSRRASSCVSGDDRRQLCDESKLNEEAVMSSYGSIVYQMRDAHIEASGTCDFVCKALRIIGRTALVTLILLVYTILPFIMIVIGVQYLHDCPLEPHIPVYLLVGGCFGFMKMIWVTCRQIRSRRYERLDTAFVDDNFEEIIGSASTRATDLALTFFLIIWFGLGNYWVYQIYIPDFEPTLFEPNKWCNKTVYFFALVQLAIIYVTSAVVFVLAFFFACCQKISVCFDDRLK